MKKEQTNTKHIGLKFNYKSIDEKNFLIQGVVGSDDTLDRHGDRINPKGWILENFLKNPVILLNHNSWSLPIGKALRVEPSDDGLIFDIQLSKTYEKAKEVMGLIKEGIMNAWSVGFIVIEGQVPGSDYTINRMELLELSAVTIPANPNALTPKQQKSFDALNAFIEAHGEKAEAKTEETPNEGETEPKTEEPEVQTPPLPEKTEGDSDGGEVKTLEQRVEAMEAELKELKENSEKNIQEALTKFLNKTDDDEVIVSDPTLLALSAVQAELRKENKNTGKALSLLNKVLNSSKE